MANYTYLRNTKILNIYTSYCNHINKNTDLNKTLDSPCELMYLIHSSERLMMLFRRKQPALIKPGVVGNSSASVNSLSVVSINKKE